MSRTPRIGYAGFGAYLPEIVVTNDDLGRMVDTSDEWIVRRTGISTRRVLGRDETLLGMATGAARAALEDAGVDPADVDDIRVGVNTWLRFPSLATQIQKELGCQGAAASDVSAGCAGFIYAVEEAYNRIYLERVRYGRSTVALVVGVDALSHITNWRDRSTCVLLGDGAGAVVLTEDAPTEILAIHTHADGRYGDLLYSDPVVGSQLAPEDDDGPFTHSCTGPRTFLHMDGPTTYAVAVRSMVRDVKAVLRKHNQAVGASVKPGDIDYVYPHQANLRIIEAVSDRLDLPPERVYTEGVKRHGNTSTASIPLGYWETRQNGGDGPTRPGYQVDVAFGAGFASGSMLRRTE